MTTRFDQLKQTVGSGVLGFPVTHFNEDRSLDLDGVQRHLDWMTEQGPAAMFAACGTGEFFSLSLGEFEQVARASVESVDGRLPVFLGCGYGTAMAVEFARAAARGGADGILLLPPYLMNAEQAGLVEHVVAVSRAVDVAVILYNRDNCILGADGVERIADTCPNVIGLKDGCGDLELLARVRNRIGERLIYLGGMPTHEVYAQPYFAAGVRAYSSALFNFKPELARAFFGAIRDGDDATVAVLMGDFVLPYTAIRDLGKGYAVSIVKAGMRAVGLDAGPVRAPLTDLREVEFDALSQLIRRFSDAQAA